MTHTITSKQIAAFIDIKVKTNIKGNADILFRIITPSGQAFPLSSRTFLTTKQISQEAKQRLFLQMNKEAHGVI